MRLTSTLNLIRANRPCARGWKTLTKALGSDFDSDAEINLLQILEINGVQDMLWCLRATKEDSKKIASQLSIEFAEQTLPIFERHYPNDNRPRVAIQAARDFAAGKITQEELAAGRMGAYAAADVAYAAAHAAHAVAAAYAADAADAVANAAARKNVEEVQADIIRSVLEL